MKTKTAIVIAISAFITLSFTFVSVTKSEKKQATYEKSAEATNTPAGGFMMEDKL